MNLLDQFFVLTMPLVPKPILKHLGGRYVAGAKLDDALKLGHKLQSSDYRLTFDILGESVSNIDDVEATIADYLNMANKLVDNSLELNMSCKPTQMGLLVNEDLCFDSVAKILSAIKENDGFLRFEMEDSPTVDGTLRVYERLRSQFPNNTGCVLQAMLRRTDTDIEKLLELDCPLNVRMVKGIYIEPEEIAYQEAGEVNAAYIRQTKAILAGGGFVGAATHDPILVEAILEMLAKHPEWKDRLEFQMLLGVGEELRQRCKSLGIGVRVYIPFGDQWIPYVQRRLRKNPKLARYAIFGLFKRKEKLTSY